MVASAGVKPGLNSSIAKKKWFSFIKGEGRNLGASVYSKKVKKAKKRKMNE